ncbi:hypothetical protein Leryth_007173 [Lithospermum erythrorhizon]|nr:hypothetical protein Leryth_007173 [Lithospermum erythrorhizon]
MSHNQSRGEKTESVYRKIGRSGNNQNRGGGVSGGGFKGAAGSSAAPPINQSRRKYNNAQGGQTRGSFPSVNTNLNHQNLVQNIQNGSHLPQHPSHGESRIPGTSAPNRLVDGSASKTTNTVPRPPSAGISMASSETSTPATPTKAPGGSSRSITLQFGTMSPNVVNGMHIPARTSSAPPNIDEQKCDQARHQVSGSSHNLPTSSMPKQNFPKLDVGTEGHSAAVESHSISKLKEDERVSTVSASAQIPKPSVQTPPRMPVPVSFHPQQQFPLQFRGPTPQITVPMHMPVPLPIGNQQPPMFISHPMQPPPGLIHQGQGFFSPPMPPQMSQLGNMGISMSTQFHQQQAGNFGFPRKVKITHPDTHEELKFDGSSGSHPVGSTRANSHPLPQRSNNKVTIKSAGGSNKERDIAASTSGPLGAKHSSSGLGPSFPLATVPSKKSDGESASDSKDTSTSNSASIHVKAVSGEKTSAGKKQEDIGKADVVTNQQEKVVDHSMTEDQLQVGGPSMTSSTSQPSQFDSVEDKSKAPTIMTEVAKHDKESASTATEEGQLEDINNVVASIPIPLNKFSSPFPSTNENAEVFSLDTNVIKAEDVYPEDASVIRSATSNLDSASISGSTEDNVRHDVEVGEIESSDLVYSTSGVQEKVFLEVDVVKDATSKGGKKLKDIIKRADAAAATSDLYMAYKGPDEKKENTTSVVSIEIISRESVNQIHNNDGQEDDIPDEKDHIKVEPDDWEDAADMSTSKMELSQHGNLVGGGYKNDGEVLMIKKYSRDFLLKFSERSTELPKGFELTSDIAQGLIGSIANVPRESNPSSARAIDKIGGNRPEHRVNMMVDDKWNKAPGPLVSERDTGAAGNIMGYRPGPGGNFGVVRGAPRAQMHAQYPGPLLSGVMHPPVPHGAIQINNSDSERWQRGTNFQKGLMPYPQMPQTPPPIIHRADNKYLVGKVTDEEQAKQRQLKGILNKLTPQNFERLFEQVKQLNIDNDVTLTGVISQIFDKALMEPTFCEMYANFCYYLAAELPDLSVGNEKITFKRLLLNKCQEEFERGEREQEEANKAEEEGMVKQSEAEREEKRLQARRRMLGNIRLIGELYKKRMLTERIMHECIKKLLGGPGQIPDEEDLEALCKLMSTIGEMIDHPKAKVHMDVYFDMMAKLSTNMKLSSRVRFMLLDAIDLRKNKWQQRRKVEGPKKIDEVHRDAAQEMQAQASRLARTPSFGNPVRRVQPMNFGPRGSSGFPSPGSQISGPRPIASHVRNFGGHDARVEDRHHTENRILSVPLSLRNEDSITLGPQGGLGRGMSYRGQLSAPSTPLSDAPSSVDARRMGNGLNGFSAMPDRAAYGSREDLMPRYMPERFPSQSIYDQTKTQYLELNCGNNDGRIADQSLDRTKPTSPPQRDGGSSSCVFSEERLRDMSLAAIREFYSAKDVNEVILCIKELDAPSYYPSMISHWVMDSFERKELERGLLARLLVNLARSHDRIISEDQLISGFESVLSTLEDAVNDAPKAAEFLGRLFAHVISENVISLAEMGKLIYEGGEEQGRLVEIGLAAEVLGMIFESIDSEKGPSVLNEIRTGASLQLKNFRPPGSSKPWRIDKFI